MDGFKEKVVPENEAGRVDIGNIGRILFDTPLDPHTIQVLKQRV